MNRIILFILLLTFGFGTQAQKSYSSHDKKAIKHYVKALEYSKHQESEEALVYLKKALERDNRFIEALLFSADLLRDKGRLQEVIDAYTRAIEIDPNFFPNAHFNLANIYFEQGNYADASSAYHDFLEIEKISDRNRKLSLHQLKCCDFALEAIKNPCDFNAKGIGESVNTNRDEYWPSLTADEQTLIFTRLLPTGKLGQNNKEIFQEDFWCSEKDGEFWSNSKELSDVINTRGNEGAQSITADGRYMYFTACGRADGRGRCDIYYSKKVGDIWSEPLNCGPAINTRAWEAQPSISADGRSLYFVSNRKSGKGKMDIWKSDLIEILDNGKQRWTAPENLKINTKGNEMSPFIHSSNAYLVFASDGLIGMGAYDLYKVVRTGDGLWSEPENFSYPINTHKDEIGLIINARGNKGYFSSDRVTENGRDIYQFEMPTDLQPPLVNYLKGRVFDDENGKALAASLMLLDIETRDTVAYLKSDRKTGEYLICLPSGKNYLLNAKAEGYLFYSDHFAMKEMADNESQQKDIALRHIKLGKEVVLKNIFFETDSWEIKAESEGELNGLYEFLVSNKTINIEVCGHTDNTGSDKRNIILSENRAKAVFASLIERGIEEDRLSYKGYAATKPIADNNTEEGKAMNRRTEFIVTQ